MLKFMILLALCVFISWLITLFSKNYDSVRSGIRHDFIVKVLYFFLIIVLILFAGLRTKYNDTGAYMFAYTLIDTNEIRFSTLFESYGGFELYQQLLKKYVSDEPQVFIFITSAILNLLFVPFLSRHSNALHCTMFFYVNGMYLFGMAGLKQAFAVGISLIAIELMMKNRYIGALLFLCLATTFHPYIICLLALPFLRKKTWGTQTLLVILVAVICAANLESLLGLIGQYGKEYDIETMYSSTINPFRVIIEAVPILISYVFRRAINDSENDYLILGINMHIIKFIFIFLGLFMNPVYFGRIGGYFTSLTAISIPLMLECASDSVDRKYATVLKGGFYSLFSVYYYLDMTDLGRESIMLDKYGHMKFSEFISLLNIGL